MSTAFFLFFFRDPERTPPEVRAGDVLSPADGRVVAVDEIEDARVSGDAARRVCIFMSIVDVHVNRAPVDGRVREVTYNPGRFCLAFREKASELNEQNDLVVDTPRHGALVVKQIAGWVARRIICRVGRGDVLKRGERFGLICFGSRVDLHMPPGTEVHVEVGARVRAGESIIATLPASDRGEEP